MPDQPAQILPPVPLKNLASATVRLASLDQLRGYAIFGMILVNYLGDFRVMPEILKHHSDSMSYADTIAPLFMFVVGMGFRLSFLRNLRKMGIWRARWIALRRYVGLTIFGICFYGVAEYKVGWWDALVDIGFAGILAIPVIERSASVRVAAAAGCMGIFQFLFSRMGYGNWLMNNSMDGGPLGPLSWAFPLLMGTLACDFMATQNPRKIIVHSLAWGVGLSVAGWVLCAPWPGVKEFWFFTQKGMTAPYAVYSTGLSFLVFLFFYLVCDVGGFRFPQLSVLGENALVLYCVQSVFMNANKKYPPRDCDSLKALAAYAVFYFLCYAVARKLHNDRVVIKL